MAKENSSVPSSKERYIAEPSAGDEFYKQGWRHYASKDWKQAEVDFRKALDLSPNHPDIIYALGLTLHSSGQTDAAVEAFERVVQLLEDVPPELRDRATIMSNLAKGHISRIKTGEWDQTGI